MVMQKLFIVTGGILGMLGVIIGAFGAHALQSRLAATDRIETFETAVKYQFYHALALILVGILLAQFQHRAFEFSGWSMITGIILFSGSLYVLSLTGITKLGAVAPIGGLAFIIGWGFMIWGAIKSIQ